MDQNFDLKKPTHLIALFLVLFVLLTIPLTVLSVLNSRDQSSQAANTTAIYIQPSSQSVNVGANLVVQIRENSGTTGVTTADITLTYDAARLDFLSVDPVQPTDPFSTDAVTPSGGGGTVNIVRFIPLPSSGPPVAVTGDKFIATVRFRAKTTAGATTVNVDPASVVYGINGTDETSTRTGGNYIIVDPPPTVSMTAPANGAHVRGTIAISADATDNVGVTKVDFFEGGGLIGTDSVPSGNTYATTWATTTTTNGTKSLTARAHDASGSTTSSPITIVVDNVNPTSVSISGLPSKVKGSVTVTGSASDANLDRLEFRVDSGSSTSDNTSPFQYNLNSTSLGNGSHTLTVTAFDRAGNSTAASQTFTVDNQAPTTPTVSGVSNSETTVDLSWTASTDSLSGPVTYDVYRNGTKITPTPIASTTYQATGLTASTTYSFVVRAMDTLGNFVDSNTLNVTTKNPPKEGDVNLDGFVNSADLAILLSTWGSTADLRADINKDGRVTSADLAKLISRWGT
jgi:hypothetical protein